MKLKGPAANGTFETSTPTAGAEANLSKDFCSIVKSPAVVQKKLENKARQR